MSDNDDAITKPIIKKEKKPMSEEAKAKLAKAREVVAANRAAKKAELEAAKEIVRAKAAKAPVVEEAPAPVKTKSTKKAAPAVIVQEEESEDEAPPVVIIKKKKPKKPQVVYESASETDEEEPAPQPTPRATKSQQHKSTKQPFGKVAGSEAPVQRFYFA